MSAAGVTAAVIAANAAVTANQSVQVTRPGADPVTLVVLLAVVLIGGALGAWFCRPRWVGVAVGFLGSLAAVSGFALVLGLLERILK